MDVLHPPTTHHQNKGGTQTMKGSAFTNYEELPLFLSAKLVAQTLGISRSSAYELMHDKDFPALRIGSRIIVPKEDLRKWVADNTKGVQN